MSRKNLINSVSNAVEESLIGWNFAFPHLDLHTSRKVILIPTWESNSDKVSVVGGGGSGHEPFAAGFVGSGMLDAAIAGSIFASPPSSNILHALKCVSANSKAGVLVIISNYTGDRLNFGLAIEKAKLLGIKVMDVLVAEDCSIPKTAESRAGKRGLSGILFVMKIAGALAKRGFILEDVAKYSEIVIKNMATNGVVLSACTVPGQGPMFVIPDDEIEFGSGIHGEAGYERSKLERASKVVSRILEKLTETLSLSKDDSVVIIISNLGGLSQLEMGIIINETVTQVRSTSAEPLRVYAGTLVSSLDSVGFHISILRLSSSERDLFISCLDDPTDAPHWPGRLYTLPPQNFKTPFCEQERDRMEIPKMGPELNSSQRNLFRECLQRASQALIVKESFINNLDRGCGDGDCGTTLRHLAQGILTSLDNLLISHPSSLFTQVSYIAEDEMGGTSGALYSLIFTLISKNLKESSEKNWLRLWSISFRDAIEGVMRYSKAELGDKTMLDAMDPGCRELENNLTNSYIEVSKKVMQAVQHGCESTKNMIAKAGRASYVKQDEFLGQIDAGAFGVFTWVTAIAEAIINAK